MDGIYHPSWCPCSGLVVACCSDFSFLHDAKKDRQHVIIYLQNSPVAKIFMLAMLKNAIAATGTLFSFRKGSKRLPPRHTMTTQCLRWRVSVFRIFEQNSILHDQCPTRNTTKKSWDRKGKWVKKKNAILISTTSSDKEGRKSCKEYFFETIQCMNGEAYLLRRYWMPLWSLLVVGRLCLWAIKQLGKTRKTRP